MRKKSISKIIDQYKALANCNSEELFRDRPFNLQGGYGFFFSDNMRLGIFIFFVAQSVKFFPEFNIRLYDKTLNQTIFFFPPPKSECFFQQQWESEYFFRKNHNPPSSS